MQARLSSKAIGLALAVGCATLGSGCGLIDVEMTSTPEVVRYGDPVTFDIKLTNTSQCPIDQASAVLVAFIRPDEFSLQAQVDVGPDAPPEVLEFLQALTEFFDELCAGGDPDLPEPPDFPDMATTCRRGDGELVCEATGPAPARQDGGGSMTFAGLGDRLRCEVDGGTMSCRFRIALPSGQAASGGASAQLAIQNLNCLTPEQIAEDIGIPIEEIGDELSAFCIIGTDFMNPGGLGAGEMATGQVRLPARGAGAMRNLVLAVGPDEEDAGVCKGGANAGQACDQSDTTPCPGSTCGEGICDQGANDGKGCDPATAMVDCPGGSCVLCATDAGPGILPLDCTTTRVSPQPAPTASPWGLGGLAALLFAGGSFWLHRRSRSRA